MAGRELHVVAAGIGYRTDDPYALPEARVLVDRPGQDVSLVLLDRGTVHWRVEATARTVISEIILSGPRPDDSEVSLSGIPMTGVRVRGLPLVYNPWGRDFRKLVAAVTDGSGTDRLHSFQGSYQVRADPLRVDRIDTTTEGLARDYLSPLLADTRDLPPGLRGWTELRGSADPATVAFDESGISLTDPSGTRRFPATADIPAIQLPVTGVYDPGSQMIYAITYGGDGYLYSVDTRTGQWAVVSSLDEYDPAELLYDAENGLLITTGAFSRPGEIRVFGLDGSRASVFVPTTSFPGLTDLFDYGNEHGPPLKPRAYRDGWLLLETRAAPDDADDADDADPDTGAYRIYALRIATGEVRLLAFGND
ncbi:MAG: hypothetical protein KDA50_04190 [Rhodobacteraceae bacterium]|nr:hypothetical protein [Paracoccaceae bacterium]